MSGYRIRYSVDGDGETWTPWEDKDVVPEGLIESLFAQPDVAKLTVHWTGGELAEYEPLDHTPSL